MASIDDQLEQLVSRFTLVTDTAGAIRPGKAARFQVQLPIIDPGVSDWLSDAPVANDIKHEFTGAFAGDIQDGAVSGNIVAGALNGTLLGTVTGLVAGSLQGESTGTMNTVARSRERVPVSIVVKWRFTDPDSSPPSDLAPGVHFLSSDPALTNLSLSVLFKPPILEMRLKPRLPKRVRISAYVTVTSSSLATDLDPGEVAVPLGVSASALLTLPDMLLLPVELPTFLAVFRFEEFRPYGTENDTGQPAPLDHERLPGFVLIVYPENCPVPASLDLLNGMLQRIDEILAPLRSLVGVATFLDELSILRRSVAAQPMARVIGAPVRKFNDIHMNVETFLGIDLLNQDMRADNRVSSLIFMGEPKRQVKCYRRHKFETSDGAFTITLPLTMFVRIGSLRIGNAAMNGIDGVAVTNTTADDFNDNMSSVRYV